MVKNSKWMVGVAIIALAATAQAGLADKKYSNSTSEPMPATPNCCDDVSSLAARVDALEAELQAAEMRAAEDHKVIAAWKPAKGWWDDTKISGRMYYNISHISDDYNTSENGFSFQIKRFYVGIDHKFNSMFSANVTTDFLYDSTAKASQIYIKKAYLSAKLDKAFEVRLGATDMPWVPFAEKLYGYRYVENTVADRAKVATSADWGVHVMGDLAGGLLNYQVSAVTGAGYKAAGERTKNFDIEARIGLDYKGFVAGIGGYIGKNGEVDGGTEYRTSERFNALVGYKTKLFTVGVEYFATSNWKVAESSSKSHGEGVSAFGSVQLAPKWAVFGRYDYVHPYSSGSKRAMEDNYYNVGVTYSPAKIVDFSLVYKHDKVDNHGGNTFSTSNGSIQGNYDEVGIWGRLRW